MFVRFVILKRDEDSHSRQGIFQAVFELRDSGLLAEYEVAWLEQELSWLQEHLKSPDCLSELGNHRALCWFHPRAKRPIEKVRSLAALLEEHGIHVKMIKTNDPGKVIYEDGWQTVAIPWKNQ